MTVDRMENQPNKETIAARESLKTGMAKLLQQRRGLSFNALSAKGCSLEVTLNFQEGDGRRGVPGSIVDFVDSQYPGRRVGLAKVYYHYHKGGTADGWNRTTSEWETTVIEEDPMSYFVSETSMREWIAGGSKAGTGIRPSIEEKHKLNPEIVLALTSLLPDPSSTTPLLDKIVDCSWLPVAIRAPFYELRSRKLWKEDPNLTRLRDLPNKSIIIYCESS